MYPLQHRFNLTPAAQTLSKNLYEQLMCILEQLVCVWVGVVFVFALEDGVISWGFTLFALLVVMTSRAVTVFPLAAAVNAKTAARGLTFARRNFSGA